MTLTQRIMRLFAPVCEKHRMDFRQIRSMVEAHTDDLMRTVCQPNEECRNEKASAEHRRHS